MVQWRCSTSLFQSEKKLAGVYKYLTVNIEKWGKTWRQRTLHPCGKMHLETIDHFHGPIKLLSASHEEFGGYPGKLQSPCASEHPRFAMHNLVKHTTDIKPRTATCQMPLPEKEGKSSYFWDFSYSSFSRASLSSIARSHASCLGCLGLP